MIATPPAINPSAGDLQEILQRTSGLWEELRGRNIFVTGGTGFFGRWLLESFAFANQSLRLGARMMVLSRDPEAFRSKAPHLFRAGELEFVSGDVRSFTRKELERQITHFPEQFDFVIHAATEASAKLNAEDPLRMIDTIVEGTRASLEFAIESGARRFLLTSSGAVYGQQPSEVTHVTEECLTGPDFTKPDSAYAEGKRMAELLCSCYQRQHGLDVLIARCFAFVGPFLPLDTHFAIGNFIRDALQGGPIKVGGDGTPHRSYLYAGDLAAWLWTILFRGKPSRPYNVGSSVSLSIREVAEAVRRSVAPTVSVTVARTAVAGAAPARYVPSTARAERELGLKAEVAIDEAIRRTVASVLRGEKAWAQ